MVGTRKFRVPIDGWWFECGGVLRDKSTALCWTQLEAISEFLNTNEHTTVHTRRRLTHLNVYGEISQCAEFTTATEDAETHSQPRPDSPHREPRYCSLTHLESKSYQLQHHQTNKRASTHKKQRCSCQICISISMLSWSNLKSDTPSLPQRHTYDLHVCINLHKPRGPQYHHSGPLQQRLPWNTH